MNMCLSLSRAARHGRSVAASAMACMTLMSAHVFAADDLAYFDPGLSPQEQMARYIETEGAERIKGVRRVLVPQFRIEFQMRTESSASDGRYLGGGSHASASNSVHVHLKGIDDPLLQQLTDALYVRFVEDMRAQGIEVIGPEQLALEPEYEPILRVGKASGETLETKNSISRFFAPGQGRVYALLRRTDKDRQGFGSSFSTAFSDMTKEIPKAELALAKKYGAPCLKVLLTVSPARVRSSAASGGGIIGAAVSLMSSTEIKPGLTVTEESRLVLRSAEHSENDFKMMGGSRFFGRKVRDFSEEGDSAIFLKQDVRVAAPISETGLQETTSAYHKVSNVLAPVMALTLGVSNRHEEYAIDADPQRFRQVAENEVAAANRMLIAGLRQASDALPVPVSETASANPTGTSSTFGFSD